MNRSGTRSIDAADISSPGNKIFIGQNLPEQASSLNQDIACSCTLLSAA
jgi:hypothetical protein